MNNFKKNFWTVGLSIILVAIVSIYIYKDLNKSNIKPPVQAGESKNEPVSVDLGKSGEGYKVDVEGIKSKPLAIKPPAFGDLVVNSTGLDVVAFEIISKNIATLETDLKKDPKDASKLLNLAIFRKMVGDYKTSVNILNYVTAVWPSDYTAYNNLADLYQSYIKNYPLAEKNWLKVIALKPDYSDAYQNLYTLYTTGYSEKSDSALQVLLKGLSENPHSTDLMVNIARYYKIMADKDQSVVYYNKAIAEARAQQNSQLEASLSAELADLSK